MPPQKHKMPTSIGKPRKSGVKNYLEFRNVDRCVETALYYGFSPLPAPLTLTRDDREKARSLGEEHESATGATGIAEKIALFRYYTDKKLYDSPQPLLLCSELTGTGLSKKGHAVKHFFLDIMGGSKSIEEAILIKTVWAILSEEGHSNMTLGLNSIGDRDSQTRFTRELVSYYRKRIALLTPSCRTTLKVNPLELLGCPHEKCLALALEAPKSIGFLSEGSRTHFKEVLEYLEELEIPYSIEHALTGSRALSTETVWNMYTQEGLPAKMAQAEAGETRELLAEGFRYTIGRRLGQKRDVPGTGAVIFLRRDKDKNGTRVRIKKPNFLFLQLGCEAKIKSLQVIELLRVAGIPLYQTVARDKLMAQLTGSEHLKIPYTIIMGQKEALENAVIVRHNVTRAQEIVKISDLPSYLKKLKLA
ncbi:MAG: His/Gly/Thr/Pro-type tRNA ligase C-terminal domain-containing protein [bacterium]|nr:His/Gly/Thr/Pro-type tRNA ligase C-terminal domain-containing protein [bacterium]